MSSGMARLGRDAREPCPQFANSSREGYKEEHDLVMIDSADEPHDGDEKQEEPHSQDPSDDVDAGDNAEAFPPGSHANQQQPDQLESKEVGGWRMEESEAKVPSEFINY
ncbi:UNVERIFIED_CONTAM: hypothetical protein K2H54_041524 [Gekko kuhli]